MVFERTNNTVDKEKICSRGEKMSWKALFPNWLPGSTSLGRHQIKVVAATTEESLNLRRLQCIGNFPLQVYPDLTQDLHMNYSGERAQFQLEKTPQEIL